MSCGAPSLGRLRAADGRAVACVAVARAHDGGCFDVALAVGSIVELVRVSRFDGRVLGARARRVVPSASSVSCVDFWDASPSDRCSPGELCERLLVVARSCGALELLQLDAAAAAALVPAVLAPNDPLCAAFDARGAAPLGGAAVSSPKTRDARRLLSLSLSLSLFHQKRLCDFPRALNPCTRAVDARSFVESEF